MNEEILKILKENNQYLKEIVEFINNFKDPKNTQEREFADFVRDVLANLFAGELMRDSEFRKTIRNKLGL